jgi:lipoic acid synthetase
MGAPNIMTPAAAMPPAPSPAAGRLPEWLKRPLGGGEGYARTAKAVGENRLNTICEDARCPNRGECWSRGTATFLILGDVCTRRCGFCSVLSGKPPSLPDPSEPARVAEAARSMGLKYVVVTSVDRDDLPDGGAEHFRQTIDALREAIPGVGIELLTPDFRRVAHQALEILADRAPFVWGHNVETVPRLYRQVRPGSEYAGSLDLLRRAAQLSGVEAKSAIMLGLGESDDEIREVLRDLREAGVQRVSIGQYLRPTAEQLPVLEYVTPEKFAQWEAEARALGFGWAKAGPFVRSSYHAEERQSA